MCMWCSWGAGPGNGAKRVVNEVRDCVIVVAFDSKLKKNTHAPSPGLVEVHQGSGLPQGPVLGFPLKSRVPPAPR